MLPVFCPEKTWQNVETDRIQTSKNRKGNTLQDKEERTREHFMSRGTGQKTCIKIVKTRGGREYARLAMTHIVDRGRSQYAHCCKHSTAPIRRKHV